MLDNFIVLEGLDGSGTTTQAELLTKRLTEAGASVHATFEPSRGPVGALVRRILRRELAVDPRTLALLFAADRNEHLYSPDDGVVKQLTAGRVVVCDRYLFSSLAYQSVACGFDFAVGLNDRFPLPQYLVFLDVPPEECQRRLASRSGVELFDGFELQQQILENYERGIARLADARMRLIRVDGSEAVERVAEKIWSALSALPIQTR